jgi:hypothetical protein
MRCNKKKDRLAAVSPAPQIVLLRSLPLPSSAKQRQRAKAGGEEREGSRETHFWKYHFRNTIEECFRLT